MRVTSLKLTNIRAIEAAEFRFKPGFNLIVGVNGVGKTSVLRALTVNLSAIVRGVNREARTSSVETFAVDDIRFKAGALTAECHVDIAGEAIAYLTHRPRTRFRVKRTSRGLPRAPVTDIPEIHGFLNGAPRLATDSDEGGRPFALFFGVGRASDRSTDPTKGSTHGGIRSAISGAFRSRSLRVSELEEWVRVQQRLRKELPQARRVMAALEKAIQRFLPGYKNLRVVERPQRDLVIDLNGKPLPVRQLSDGERGVLSIVVDLTRRLALGNPTMPDPASKAEAVVMIDEIDLHLHPKWQRQIVRNLTAAFPRCQFIATTHSPQVIGEVHHDRIQIIADGQVYSPSHSFGVDSSRILEEIMDADPRSQEIGALLSQISQDVGKQRYESARELLVQLVEKLGENDPEVTRIRTLLDFMQGEL